MNQRLTPHHLGQSLDWVYFSLLSTGHSVARIRARRSFHGVARPRSVSGAIGFVRPRSRAAEMESTLPVPATSSTIHDSQKMRGEYDHFLRYWRGVDGTRKDRRDMPMPTFCSR